MSVVLVTGAGGFVGSAIVRRLARGGAGFSDGTPVEHVVALLRPEGSAARLDELVVDGRWSVERADVADRDALLEVMSKVHPQAVVHAALDPDVYARTDERLVRRPLEVLLEGLQGTGARRMLLVGSAWILAAGDRLDESAPLGPVNPYGSNKAREERVLAELARDAGMPWITLRLFNLFGRHEKPTRLLPSLVANLICGDPVELTHGEQIRDFNDVDVVSQAFVDALGAPEAACGAVYHIGSGIGTRVRELALRVAAMVGGIDLIRFGAAETQDEAVPILVSDPSLATQTLGWRPELDLEARLRETVDWWLPQLEPLASREVSA